MKTLQELLNAVTEAKQAYDKAAALPLITSRHAVLAMRRREYRAAVIAYQNTKRRVALGEGRHELASLKAVNLELSEARSATEAENQRLAARCNELIADAAKTAQQGNGWASDAERLSERVSDLETGAKETRTAFDQVLDALHVDTTGKGIIKDMDKARLAIQGLWKLIEAKKNTPAPEVAEAIENVPGFEGQLEALALPNDKLDIAVLRAAVKYLPTDWVNQNAADILRAVSLPREKRNDKGGKPIWCILIMRLRGVSFGVTPIEAARAATPNDKRKEEKVTVLFPADQIAS